MQFKIQHIRCVFILIILLTSLRFDSTSNMQKEELLKQPVIQADETTLKVNRDGRKAGASSYMWVYITGEHDDSGKKIILYNYCRTRSTEHLRNFLSAYQGTLVSDGYQPYHTFLEEQALASAGCWTHCRRATRCRVAR